VEAVINSLLMTKCLQIANGDQNSLMKREDNKLQIQSLLHELITILE
jgi:hypothetical protein